MRNQILGFAVLVVMFAITFGWFREKYNHSNTSNSENSKQEQIKVSESPDQIPPETLNGNYGAVNSERLQKLAGENYKGPSYVVKAQEVDTMIAEQKRTPDRIPASNKDKKE